MKPNKTTTTKNRFIETRSLNSKWKVNNNEAIKYI